MPYLSSTSSDQTWQLRVPLTPWAVIGWRDCDYKRVHHLSMVRCFATLLQMTWFHCGHGCPLGANASVCATRNACEEGLFTAGCACSPRSSDKSNAHPL